MSKYNIIILDEDGKEVLSQVADKYMLLLTFGTEISKSFSSNDIMEHLGMIEFIKYWIINSENIGKSIARQQSSRFPFRIVEPPEDKEKGKK